MSKVEGSGSGSDPELGRQVAVVDMPVDHGIEPTQGDGEGIARVGRTVGVDSRQARPEDARVGLAEEQRDATTDGRENVLVLPWDSVNEALETETTQIIGHPASGVASGTRVVKSPGALTERSVRAAIRRRQEVAEGCQNGHDARLAEAETGHALSIVGHRRQHDGLEGADADDAVLAGALEGDEAPVDVAHDGAQVREVGQRLADAEVIGVVNHRLGAEGPALLEVLLEPRVLVFDGELGLHPVLDHAGAEGARSRVWPSAHDPSVEEKLDTVWSSEVEVLPDDLLEELATRKRSPENLGKAELHLPDREAVRVAGGTVLAGEGVGQPGEPTTEEQVHVIWAERIADLLQRLGLLAGQKSVVERLEADSLLAELLFDPLVAVEAHAHTEGHVRRELDEAGAPVAIQDVEVVMVDRYRRAEEVKPSDRAVLAATRLGAEGAVVLLGNPDEHDAFASTEPSELLASDVVLPLVGCELHDGDAIKEGELLDGRDEPFRHLPEKRWRRQWVLAVDAQEIGKLVGLLQHLDVAAQVEPIDALDLERDLV